MKRSIGLLGILALAAPLVALSAEPAWWTQQKRNCGLSPGLAYNTWVSQGSPCNSGKTSSGSSSGSVGTTIGRELGTAIGNELNKALWGDPAADARRKAEAETAAEAARLRAAEAEAARLRAEEETLKKHEEMKSRLLGGMMGVDGSPSLGLMGVESGPGLSLMTDSASAIAPPAGKKSDSFTKGFEHASQCISQNAGSACAGVTADRQQSCVADYRGGYDSGSIQKKLVLQEAYQAGQSAAARGELANGASDPRALGPCRTDWIMAYNNGHFGAKSPSIPEKIKPTVAAVDTRDPEVTRIINDMNALAKKLGWSADEQARLDKALNNLVSDGDGTSAQSRQAWQNVLARGQGEGFAREASQGVGPGFPGAGTQSYQDCAVFALANASGLPYGVVAARATELIRQGEWRDAAERANPQKVIEQKGLIGGEVIMLAEALGQAEVVTRTDFAKTLKEGRPVMVSVVPADGDFRNGHEVVLTKVFQRGGETWYEMMDSNQGPQRRLYVSAKELTTIQKENGVAFRPEPGTTTKLLR